MSWHCTTKLATSTARGRRRYSPQAIDQHRKTSSVNGNRPAEGFHTSWSTSGASERLITTIASAVANIIVRPPRRLASTTEPTIAALLSRPIVTARDHGPAMRTGTASSQNSIGPRL